MAEWLVELLKVIFLGLVEGVTEFLPVSSTGHLIIVTSLLDLNDGLNGTFEIFIQIGAALAVIWHYRRDFRYQFCAIRNDIEVQRLWFSVLAAFAPTAFLGFMFGIALKEALFQPVVIASALIFGGIMFLVVEYSEIGEDADTTRLVDVSIRQALIIGLLQALALIPGMSRSGVSIIGGLLSGIDRNTATQFSFYLAIPTLLSATIYDLLQSLEYLTITNLAYLLLGAFVSAVVAWVSIRWLLHYIANNNFVSFGYYRILIGGLILILIAVGWLPGA